MSGTEYTDEATGPLAGGLGPCLSLLTMRMEVLEARQAPQGLIVEAVEREKVDWLRLYRELAERGCVAYARREGGSLRILVTRRVERPRIPLALGLGAAVVLTLYISGVFYVRGAPEGVGGLAWSPLSYLAGLLVPLLIHEFGHYVTMRRYGVPSSVPIPLPAPPYPWFLGTFGSIILMRWPPPTADALALIGLAGPLAGFIVALPVALWGLHSSVALTTPPPGTEAIPLVPLAMLLLSTVYGPRGEVVILSPPAFAAYVMFFVTFLNLMPIGQLDGGHVVRAAVGERGHSLVSKAFIAILIATSLFLPYLAAFGVLALLLYLISGGRHPGPAFPEERLSAWGQLAVILYAMLLVLTVPIPISALA